MFIFQINNVPLSILLFKKERNYSLYKAIYEHMFLDFDAAFSTILIKFLVLTVIHGKAKHGILKDQYVNEIAVNLYENPSWFEKVIKRFKGDYLNLA